MRVDRLELRDFRSYRQAEITFPAPATPPMVVLSASMT